MQRRLSDLASTTAGSLESSNTDLTTQLVNMMTAQRNYQANSQVISTEELQSLVFCLGTGLSRLESDALRLYLEGNSYEQMADDLGCDTKTIDNALQRVKRKILAHQAAREVLR